MGGYEYTLLKQDGTTENLGVYPEKMSLQQLYETLTCDTIQIIPESYYEGHGKCTMFADEEGRFSEKNHRNPHFKVLHSFEAFGVGITGEFDVVGDVLKEKKL